MLRSRFEQILDWMNRESLHANKVLCVYMCRIFVGTSGWSSGPNTSSCRSYLSYLAHPPYLFVGSTPTDRKALAALFNATNGRSWEHSQGWCTTAKLKHWYGVTVDEQGRVVELRLPNNKMKGKLSTRAPAVVFVYSAKSSMLSIPKH